MTKELFLLCFPENETKVINTTSSIKILQRFNLAFNFTVFNTDYVTSCLTVIVPTMFLERLSSLGLISTVCTYQSQLLTTALLLQVGTNGHRNQSMTKLLHKLCSQAESQTHDPCFGCSSNQLSYEAWQGCRAKVTLETGSGDFFTSPGRRSFDSPPWKYPCYKS